MPVYTLTYVLVVQADDVEGAKVEALALLNSGHFEPSHIAYRDDEED